MQSVTGPGQAVNYLPSSVEWKVLTNVCHGGPQCADYLEPGREVFVVFSKEGGEGVSVVWSVLLSLTQAVNQDDGEAGGDLPLLVQSTERLEDALLESLARVGVAAVDVELLPDVLVRLEEVVVGGELGGLAELGRHGVDELRHQTGGGVVGLTEVVGHRAGGEEGGGRHGAGPGRG